MQHRFNFNNGILSISKMPRTVPQTSSFLKFKTNAKVGWN